MTGVKERTTIETTSSATSTGPSPRGRRSTAPRPTNFAGIAVSMPFWVLTGALAIIFLYPLVWTAISSVAPLAGTNQTDGWGFGNYTTLAEYQDGILQYIGNSVFVSVLTVILTLVISLLGGYAFARFRFVGKNVLF
jgi:multiple sugar transport system permease protein